MNIVLDFFLVLLLTLNEFSQKPSLLVYSFLLLSKLISFYSPWNHRESYGFFMILEGTEVA